MERIKNKQAKSESCFTAGERAGDNYVLTFAFSPSKWILIFYQGLASQQLSAGGSFAFCVCPVLPKTGAAEGPLWPHSQKGNFGKIREKLSRMFVFRCSLHGAWLPQSPVIPTFLLRSRGPPETDSCTSCAQWPQGPRVRQVSGHAHGIIPERPPGETRG